MFSRAIVNVPPADMTARQASAEAAVEEVLARELPTTRKDVLQRVAGAIVKLFDLKVSELTPDNSGPMPTPVWTARQPAPHMPDELKLGRQDASQDSWVVVRGHWCHHSSATADICRAVLAGAYSDQVKTMYSERLAELEGAADIPQVAMTNEELYPPGDPTSRFTTVLASDSPREALAKLNSGCGGVLFLDEVTKLDIDDRTILQVLKNDWTAIQSTVPSAPASRATTTEKGVVEVGGLELQSTEYDSDAPLVVSAPPEVCSKCGVATGLACHNCEGITPVCANCECPKCGK